MREYQNSLYPEEWREKAHKDWERVKRNIKEDDPEVAGFFLQQALEKYLKAFLLERNWKLRKIHTLTTLFDYAVEHFPYLEEFRTLCERVTDYYFAERYPKLTEVELSLESIEKNSEESEKFIKAMFPQKV